METWRKVINTGQKKRKEGVDFIIERRIIQNFIRECRVTKGWFEELGNEVEERIKRIRDDSLGKEKERIIWKL